MTTARKPAEATPIRTVDQLVAELLDLTEEQAGLAERITATKAQIAELVGLGNSTKVGDVTVSVRTPNRSFDVNRAFELLNDEQKALAVSPDARKIKSLLPPVLAETCMTEGSGNPIVSVR